MAPNSEAAAAPYYGRLLHRMVAALPKDQPFASTSEEIQAHIDDMKRIERETASDRAAIKREPPPIAIETGADVVWDSAETKTPSGSSR